MKITTTDIEGVFILESFKAKDNRGVFVKTFSEIEFLENNLSFEIKESYYSISQKNVIRGMHFQLPPHDHDKLVYVSKGEIIDVVVDLREKSKTFKKVISVNLSSANGLCIYIPKGCAHGFKSLEDETITVYNVSTCYNPKFDDGVRYDSFGFNWRTKDPIMSKRDEEFSLLDDFVLKGVF